MEKYRVLIKPSAVKEIESIPRKNDRQRIIEKIRQLGEEPRPPACQKLSGHERYRIRQGPYRIVYGIEDGKRLVYVVIIGHRKNVYRDIR